MTMEQFLLSFPTRVDVLSPVHIGTGEELSSKSFVRRGDRLTVVDENRLLAWVAQDPRRADAFVRFAESRDGLGRFLKAHKGRLSEIAAYQIGYQGSDFPRRVQVFIKSAGQWPYLPGSSLKGALRSALLRGVMVHSESVNRWANRRLRELTRSGDRSASQTLEAYVFVPKDVPAGKRSNYDLIRALAVSDSRPIRTQQLEAVVVRVLSVQSNGSLQFKTLRSGRVMTLYAETLRPGTSLDLTLTLNRALLEGAGPAAELAFGARKALLLDIGRFCRLAAGNLIEQEIEFFRRHRRPDLVEWYERLGRQLEGMTGQTCLLPVGWGSGFDAKTITDLLDDAIFESVVSHYPNTRGLGRPGGRGAWLGPDDSPKSRKVVVHSDDRLEPLGWLRLRF